MAFRNQGLCIPKRHSGSPCSPFQTGNGCRETFAQIALLCSGQGKREHPCPGLRGTSQHPTEPVLGLAPSWAGFSFGKPDSWSPQRQKVLDVSWVVLVLLNSFQTHYASESEMGGNQGLGPKAEPEDSIVTTWEKPPAPKRVLAFLRDTLVSSGKRWRDSVHSK